MSDWIYLKAVEELAVWLSLFALLTACFAHWRQRKLGISILVLYVLFLTGTAVAFFVLGAKLQQAGVDFSGILRLTGVVVVIHWIGFGVISWFGWRRSGEGGRPAAAAWPRLRLLLVFAVAVLLSFITDWNVGLAVRQRLAHQEAAAGLMALEATPARPIDAVNAALLYEPALKDIEATGGNSFQAAWIDFDQSLDANDPEVRQFLGQFQRELEQLHRAGARPNCYFERGSLLWENAEAGPAGSSRLKWYTLLNQAARLLVVDVRVKIAEGDLDGAAVSTNTVFRVAGHAAQDGSLIPLLVSKTANQRGVECLQELLNAPNLSREVLDRIESDGAVNFQRELKRALVLEEAFAIALVRRSIEEGIAGVLESEPDHFGEFAWKLRFAYFIEPELQSLRQVYREMRAAVQLPYPEASERLAEITDPEALAKRGLLASLFIPALGKVLDQCAIRDARLRLARLAVALRRYEFEHGNLPENFDAVVPEFLDDVPIDFFNGEAIKMEKTEEGVRLYAAGVEALQFEKEKDREQMKAEIFLKRTR